ncbi:MAG TPA: hypothetical protein VJU84_02470 [Pyrinomonadaceae bacterium]|nr:hypothetical protein [Pyrinomonadaceae bacterium]
MRTQLIKAALCIIITVSLAPLGLANTALQGDPEVDALIVAAKFLEEHPLDKNAKDMRSKAMVWVIKTDKVSVKMCSLIMKTEKGYKFNSELLSQYTIAMAAFKLANPEKAADENAVQQAGIDSALVAYDAIVKENPKARDSFMDGLLARRADATFAKYVLENNCTDKK